MGVKFGMEEGTVEGTFGPLYAKFHPHRCNVSPLRGEKPENQPLSKLNTGALRCKQTGNECQDSSYLQQVETISWHSHRELLCLACILSSCLSFKHYSWLLWQRLRSWSRTQRKPAVHQVPPAAQSNPETVVCECPMQLLRTDSMTQVISRVLQYKHGGNIWSWWQRNIFIVPNVDFIAYFTWEQQITLVSTLRYT